MLELKDIRKSYTTANFTQNALDGVSIAFRENEFAAVLGPSGSGKTTMLNIIGGLDQCDSGDLKIDNVSTKKFKDRDWDTYRNNRIGFVFQSYNLIPHQTILSNVELALTLSGVSKLQRRARAIEALKEVGLEMHIRKKPSQLSGGQMQRVAIARALINDPEILLADEPTGAVDSETGLIIMDLLTRIAKDRLVIMVTHNNELAEQYANRIVHLKDGNVVTDSNPFSPSEDWERPHDKIRKASMSFRTAIALSFSNLMTKKGRTFVTSLAGSIGIIGIATILALANGINLYIQRIEEETLSLYPLMIQTTGFDLSDIFGTHTDTEDREARPDLPPDSVREIRVVESMFGAIHTNDLAALKYYFEFDNTDIHNHVRAIHYLYDVTPQIFLSDTSNGVHQVNPDDVLAASGMMPPDAAFAMGFGTMPGMSYFFEMPDEPALYIDQYEILRGRWPQNYDEAVLILSSASIITDFELYSLGLRDREEFRAMLDSFMGGTELEIELDSESGIFSYDDLMSVEFRVVNPADIFQYDYEFSVWVDRSGDDAFMRSLVDDGLTLRIVGIMRPDPNATATILSSGINYTSDLIHHLIEQAANSRIVRDQLAQPEVNVISGRTFADEEDDPETIFDFSRIISVDEGALEDMFDFELDESDFDFEELDFSGMELNASDFDFDFADFDFDFDPSALDLSAIDFDISDLDFDMSDMQMEIPPFDLDIPDLGDLEFDIDLDNIPMPDIEAIMAPIGGRLFAHYLAFFQEYPVPQVAPEDSATVQAGLLSAALSGVVVEFSTTFILMNLELFVPPDRAGIENALNLFLNPVTQIQIRAAVDDIFDDPLIPTPSNDIGEEALRGEVANLIPDAVRTFVMDTSDSISVALERAMVAVMEELGGIIGTQIQTYMTELMGLIMTTVTTQVQQAIGEAMQQVMTQVVGELATAIGNQIETAMTGAMEQLGEQIGTQIQDAIEEVFEDFFEELQGSMEEMFEFDEDAFAEAFQINMGEEEVFELMMAIMNPAISTFDRNLTMLGYADLNSPSQINIYPLNFEAKQAVLDILDEYNERMEEQDRPYMVIHFVDIVGVLMASVVDIVDLVGYGLIAFVSISLIVSSIMIGVITFISVLERKKEIGILRAIGASKQNIRTVFNAEALIIGFVAGVLGVLITYVIVIIGNIILFERFDIVNLAQLPTVAAFVLVGVSMFLTFIAGLFPSSAAARKDPVEALRSE